MDHDEKSESSKRVELGTSANQTEEATRPTDDNDASRRSDLLFSSQRHKNSYSQIQPPAE